MYFYFGLFFFSCWGYDMESKMNTEDYYRKNKQFKIDKHKAKLEKDWSRIYIKWKVLLDKAIQGNQRFISYKKYKVSLEFAKNKLKGSGR